MTRHRVSFRMRDEDVILLVLSGFLVAAAISIGLLIARAIT